MIDRRRREDDERRARGEPVAQLGPSPGFRDLQWLKPVYVGDTMSYGSEVIETRPLNSRPGWGMISMRNTGVNQHGEPVISFISSGFRRAPGDPKCGDMSSASECCDWYCADVASQPVLDRRQAAARSSATSAAPPASAAARTRCTTAIPT